MTRETKDSTHTCDNTHQVYSLKNPITYSTGYLIYEGDPGIHGEVNRFFMNTGQLLRLITPSHRQ